jgi:hypothetical protein
MMCSGMENSTKGWTLMITWTCMWLFLLPILGIVKEIKETLLDNRFLIS